MPELRRFSKRHQPKRQSRLTFSPVPASSSPGIDHSSQISSDRLAYVRYLDPDSSPISRKVGAKRQAVTKSTGTKHSDPITPSSDEESIRGSSSARKPTKKRPVIEIPADGEDSDSSDVVASSPAKRRRRNPPPASPVPASPEPSRDISDSDLAEDVADLQDSDLEVTETRTRGRPTESAKKLKRREQLEALRRRRAGEVTGKDKKPKSRAGSPSTEAEEEEEEEEDDDDDDEPDGSEGSEESQPLFVDHGDSDVESAVPEDLDEYEDDFVLQDEDGELGAPAELARLPFEFSRHRYKRLRDHFKDVVEWMVHNKLNPAFPRDDELYQTAFKKVRDEVMGVAGSQLVSAVWNIDFKRALEARPQIEVSRYPISDGHPCDACNRSGHPASYDIRFDGKPYMLENLEPVTDSDDSEDSEDAEESDAEEQGSGNVGRNGHQIPDASTHFYLGRHCKSKAVMAHTLIHWPYHLNEWVIDHLQRQGVFTDENILERERWTHKRRTKFANETVDAMDEDGEVDRLWRDFNLNLKNARGAKESRW